MAGLTPVWGYKFRCVWSVSLRPAQTGLCKFGWVWCLLRIYYVESWQRNLAKLQWTKPWILSSLFVRKTAEHFCWQDSHEKQADIQWTSVCNFWPHQRGKQSARQVLMHSFCLNNQSRSFHCHTYIIRFSCTNRIGSCFPKIRLRMVFDGGILTQPIHNTNRNRGAVITQNHFRKHGLGNTIEYALILGQISFVARGLAWEAQVGLA